jgi:hypothetical protein
MIAVSYGIASAVKSKFSTDLKWWRWVVWNTGADIKPFACTRVAKLPAKFLAFERIEQ